MILNVIINKYFNKDFETNVKDKLFIEEQRFKIPVISSSIMIIFIITIQHTSKGLYVLFNIRAEVLY